MGFSVGSLPRELYGISIAVTIRSSDPSLFTQLNVLQSVTSNYSVV